MILTDLLELERAYGSVIAAIETEPGSAADTLGADWARCSNTFERLRAVAGSPASAEVRDALLRVQRLHAVVSSLAVRARDSAASEIARVAGVRARLPEPSVAATGRSCDVRG